MSNLIDTPMQDIPGTPSDHKGGPGVYDGEPGWKGRTMGPNSLPEKTYEKEGKFSDPGQDKGKA